MNVEPEKTILVESSNGFPGNTPANFTVRLPQALNFRSPHEIALCESSIPFDFYNIGENNFFTVSRYVEKSHAEIKSKYKPPFQTITKKYFGKKYVLEYLICTEVTPGYYAKFTDFKNAMHNEMQRIVATPDRKIVPPKTAPRASIHRAYYEPLTTELERPPRCNYWIGLKKRQSQRLQQQQQTPTRIPRPSTPSSSPHTPVGVTPRAPTDPKSDSLENCLFWDRITYDHCSHRVHFGLDVSHDAPENHLTVLTMSQEVA